MLRTVWWIACASPEMELGLMREWRILRGIFGSVSDSQMWLPSQVKAKTKDGRRKGSRRSAILAWLRLWGGALTFKPAFDGFKF